MILSAVVLALTGVLVGRLATTQASRSSQTFAADADAYVSAVRPATHFGGSTTLVVDGRPERRVYLHFTVAGRPGPVTRATLRLDATSSSRHALTVSRAADASWDEETITWSNAPSIVAAPTASSSTFDAGWVTIDVTGLVAGDGEVSLAVTEDDHTAVSLRSREAGAAGAPQLVVEADTTGTATTATDTTTDASTSTSAPSDSTTTSPPDSTTTETLPPDSTTTATTPPSSTGSDGPSPVIAAAGDIACNSSSSSAGTSCQQARTADVIAAGPAVSAVLPLGDTQYECGDYANFQRFYDPTWGRFRAITHPAIGNHEYLTATSSSGCDPATTVSGQGYFDYWNGIGAASGPAGDRSEGYYSYDIGAWHLIALNSNCSKVGGCDAGSPQGVWLRNDLAAHPNACTLAYWHHPRFSSGEHGDNTPVAPLWDILWKAGADVVLNGHDHDYERFAPQTPVGAADPATGIREFVVGTGGKSHYQIQSAHANSEVHNADTFGVLELTLHPDGYDWRFLPVEGVTFTDAGSGSCH